MIAVVWFTFSVKACVPFYGVYDFTTGDQRGLTQKDLTIVRWDAKKDGWVAISKAGGEPF